jgi:hypothetical protein
VTARDAANNTGTDVLTVTLDIGIPTVTITSPTTSTTYSTTSTPITLGGTATDNVGVAQVTWVNDRGGSGTCSGTTTWTCSSIALQSGPNVLTVTARDAANNTGTDVLTVTYTLPDTIAPTVNIASPTSEPNYCASASALNAGGTASDNVGVTQVTWVNNRGGNGTCSGTTSWSCGSITLLSGDNVITVSARDAANNIGTDILTASLYSIWPEDYDVPPSGGSGLYVAVTAGTSCAWTAVSNNSWIIITSGSSGTGNGTVVYRVTTNKYGARTGTMTIAGRTFTVYQEAGSFKAPADDQTDEEGVSDSNGEQ